MGKLIDLPSGRPTPVSETDIDNLIVLANRIGSTQAVYDRLAGDILERLKASAELEAGPHLVERYVKKSQQVSEEILVIDGVVRFRRIHGPSSLVKTMAAPTGAGVGTT